MKLLLNEGRLSMDPEGKDMPDGKSFLKLNMSASIYAKGKGDTYNGKVSDYKSVYINGTYSGMKMKNDAVASLEKGDYIYAVELDIRGISIAKNGTPAIEGYINDFTVPRLKKVNGNATVAPSAPQTNNAPVNKPLETKTSATDDADDIG